tara:strand:+ start:379 stop:1239 length:861 start_codon:yes stop_codon:yes gene_type:complete
MDPIDTIPNIITNNGMIRLIKRAQIDSRIQEGLEKPIVINTTRVWETQTPHAQQLEVPVVLQIGKPIVDMPGCVKVHKENVRQRSKNKMLVNDDPKGNTVLCDNGMPYYEPPDYQQNRLTWTTVTPKQPEADGINSETPDVPTPELPGAPTIPPTTSEEKECPGPDDLRVGDYATSGNEKVVGHEWNDDQTKCITLWEDVGAVEKYLPSPQIVSTTATIAVVATSSALLAKPIADLLMKVVKPVVKKLMAKVQKILGKTPRRPTLMEKRTDQYREKKGLLPMKRKK